MSEYRNYAYNSALAPYIIGHIAEMRALGYKANDKAYHLSRLDRYWIYNGYEDANITAERVSDWLCQLFPTESKSSQRERVGALKSLAIYMTSLGINAYVPLISIGNDHNIVHILSKKEIQELFHVIDTYQPKNPHADFLRLADEFPIIYRLFLCCGMRNNETCSIRTADADLDAGILTILNGKGNKDRLVYLPEDLKYLMQRYFKHLKMTLGFEPIWLFPGWHPENHISKITIDKKFCEFWNATESSKHCEKKPTPHSLRHTFVVNKINQWAQDNLDLEVMIPYLSKYLGHKSPDETYYYYHLVEQAFQTIHQKDTMASKVIPKVKRR